MLSSYIILYQYFDAQEMKLLDQINGLQERCLYRKERNFTYEEAQELTYLKIKLEFCRKIESELLQLFYHL